MNLNIVISSEPVSASYMKFQITLKLGFDNKMEKKPQAKFFCGIYGDLKCPQEKVIQITSVVIKISFKVLLKITLKKKKCFTALQQELYNSSQLTLGFYNTDYRHQVSNFVFSLWPNGKK